MSRLQTEGTRPYRVRPRMMPDNRPPSSTRTVETAQPERTRPPNAGAGAVPDYYALLGVERNAPRERLERLYRQYVARLHPDKFFNDARRRDLAQEKLKELNTAIKVLRDPDQRARYDSLLAGDRRPATPLLSRLAGATRS